jgi:hypothetical protein
MSLTGSWTLKWSQARHHATRDVGELSLGILPRAEARVLKARQIVSADAGWVMDIYDLEFDDSYRAVWTTCGLLTVPRKKDLWLNVSLQSGRLQSVRGEPLAQLAGYVDRALVMEHRRVATQVVVLSDASRINRDPQMRLSMMVKDEE